MQIGYILIGICIAVIANAIFEFLGYGMSKVIGEISITPLRKFWKTFLRDGGIIVIPPYPKNRSDFSARKHPSGANQLLAMAKP